MYGSANVYPERRGDYEDMDYEEEGSVHGSSRGHSEFYQPELPRFQPPRPRLERRRPTQEFHELHELIRFETFHLRNWIQQVMTDNADLTRRLDHTVDRMTVIDEEWNRR